MDTSQLAKFYKKSHLEKINALEAAGVINAEDAENLRRDQLDLSKETGDHMIENYLANYSLPFGVAMNFIIDEQEMVVPMAIEEPSVIAAASFAAKIIASSGGFTTAVSDRLMIGQVTLKGIDDLPAAAETVLSHKEAILSRANEAHPSIVKRGGGAKNMEVRLLSEEDSDMPPFLSLHLHVDTKEAMGANIINTMMEGIAPYIEELTRGTALLRILSNYSTECLATSTCTIPVSKLSTPQFSGDVVRDRIIEATQIATVDPYRAVTHNKGIMNGVDAVVVATGNDWRAVEAGVHAYASRSGQYRSLTKWTKNEAGDLVGTLTLPLPIGTVGGSIGIHPGAKLAHAILGHPTAKQLESVLASVGLAQNFAAVRALVTEGIQKGHMGLHARSLAISAGAKGEQVQRVADRLKEAPHMNLAAAKDILNNLDK